MIVRIVPLFAAALLCFGCSSAPETPPPAQGPALGVETRSPSSTEIESFGIERKLAGRPEGRVLSAVEKGSPAEKAGLKTDDLLIAFGDHALFSHDDLADAVRASDSGEAVTLRIKRSGTREEIRVPVTMGQVATAKGIHWEFAGPAQFDAALAEAKKRGTKLMVGVSGAETWWGSTRFESRELSAILDDAKVVELSQKLVRIIIRRPHAYQFAADHKGVSIPGVCFFDAGGTLAGNAALKDAESLLELMRKQAK